MATRSTFNFLILFLLVFLTDRSFSQIVLKNTCSGSTESVLYTDAVNYFRIENWPGKALMNLECTGCTLEFQDPGGVFKIIPGESKVDTLSVFKDEKLVKQFVLKHQLSTGLQVHLLKGNNGTISRKYISGATQAIVKAGKPGCKTFYLVKEFDIALSSGTVHCNGDKLSDAAVKKIMALPPGTEFSVVNAMYIQGKEMLLLPTAKYILKD